MFMLSRRILLQSAAAMPLLAASGLGAKPGQTPLKTMMADAKDISLLERRARFAKVQMLMQQRHIAALLIEPGSSI